MRLIPVLNARERAYGERHPNTQLGKWAKEQDEAAKALETCVQPMDCDADQFEAIGDLAQCLGCVSTVGQPHERDCPELDITYTTVRGCSCVDGCSRCGGTGVLE